VVLATHSSLTGPLHARRLRLLPWKRGTQPRAWVALAAPAGISSNTLTALRRHAVQVVSRPAWQSLLRRDGLMPAGPASEASDGFLSSGVATAKYLRRLTNRFIERNS
jgi:tripartite-type tricarboxylate transporter receptor subunit TctC